MNPSRGARFRTLARVFAIAVLTLVAAALAVAYYLSTPSGHRDAAERYDREEQPVALDLSPEGDLEPHLLALGGQIRAWLSDTVDVDL